MSIIEDFTAIRSRLSEIEKTPAAKDADAKAAADKAIADSWMYYNPDEDTAPSEYVF